MRQWILGGTALFVYIAGGAGVFGGLGLIALARGRDFWGWGEGHTFGYLCLAVGLCLSVLGVLLMRLFRNRGAA